MHIYFNHRSRIRRRRLLYVCLVSLFAAVTGSIPAQAQQDQEIQDAEEQKSNALKAAYLYNFAKFTSWPRTNEYDSTVQFCVAKGSIAQEAFKGWGRKRVQKRSVRVSFFEDKTASWLENCSVMFVGGEVFSVDEITYLKDLAEKNSILIVSDHSRFADFGGQIELYLTDRKLRFKVNLDALQEADLTLGAAVLRLAVIVDTQGGRQ